jgi:isopenicillin N synthase-like dioxygenase
MAQSETLKGTATSLPVIDFAGFTSGDEASRVATAKAIRRAFEDFGFLYLRGHGVPQEIIDEAFAQSRAFYAFPDEIKAEAAGYSRPGYIALDPSKPVDLNETFRAGTDREHPPNHWPRQQPALRDAILSFHRAGSSTCRSIMQAIALALGLPEDYFDAPHQPQAGRALLHHFPPVRSALLPGQQRSGAHTDFGTITLVFHFAGAGGLEIQRPDGSWLPAPPLPGACVVNVGDLLMRWTNGQLRSVLHRVAAPEGEAATRSRYSAVLFYQPRPDAVISCLEPCQGPDRPACYPPITAADHVEARRRETFQSAY